MNLSSKLILKPSLILIWSLSDPIHPQLMLECPDDIFCFRFCPSDPSIIAGGCINGQVVLWDISAYNERLAAKTGVTKSTSTKTTLEPKQSNEPHLVRYCAVSSIEHGHKAVITDIHWLPDFFEVKAWIRKSYSHVCFRFSDYLLTTSHWLYAHMWQHIEPYSVLPYVCIVALCWEHTSPVLFPQQLLATQ